MYLVAGHGITHYLKAKSAYRGFVWNYKANSAEDQAIVSAMQGKNASNRHH